MTKLSMTLFGAAVILAMASTANAGTINQRQHNQTVRIFNGIASGELTLAETLRLARAKARVRQLEILARADGHIGPLERFAINQALNYQSSLIYRKKHN
ncbi:MAG: hypothetical protein WCE69_14350 [Aestuariivirga sp.]|jgi:uncharacterized membrane protein YebE (DUF533 family)